MKLVSPTCPISRLTIASVSVLTAVLLLANGSANGEESIAQAASEGLGSAGQVASAPDESEYVSLFDGKNLDGWEGNLKWFRVEKGAIVGGSLSEKIPHNEFLTTAKTYQDFELKLKLRLVGKGANSGIQLRSSRVPDSSEVAGYQADASANYWGGLYDESRRRRFLVPANGETIKKIVKPDDWNEYVIRCQGPRIQTWLNGVRTVDYTETDKDIATSGIIGLQIHSGPPTEAWFKDIRIKTL